MYQVPCVIVVATHCPVRRWQGSMLFDLKVNGIWNPLFHGDKGRVTEVMVVITNSLSLLGDIIDGWTPRVGLSVIFPP